MPVSKIVEIWNWNLKLENVEIGGNTLKKHPFIRITNRKTNKETILVLRKTQGEYSYWYRLDDLFLYFYPVFGKELHQEKSIECILCKGEVTQINLMQINRCPASI